MLEPIISTQRGAVRGRYERGVAAFKGIPFAAPPVGKQRFAAPVPPQRWDGVRDASAFSATPPQIDPASRPFPGLNILPLVGTGWHKGDDYLTLNVWTPDPSAQGLPVMVFIYGGAFVSGSSATPLYDGTSFARDGVVMVSFNYRLGIEGFLLLDGADSNLGLRDQIAALTWVQENISAFGGDPNNVTVFGESAGAISVDTLLAVPSASGLFRRAISQSGGGQHTMSIEQATRVAARFSELLGVQPTREDFAALSSERLVEAQSQVLAGSINLHTTRDVDPTGGLTLFLPVRDGDLLSAQPVEAVRQGASADVDLLLGSNSQEMNLYYVPTGVVDALDAAALFKYMQRLHSNPEKLITTYQAHRPDARPGELFAELMTNWMFAIPTVRLAEAHAAPKSRTYVYEFAWPSTAFDGKLGAAHGMELAFVFDALATPGLSGPKGLLGENPPAILAECTHKAWIAFAKHGNPGWTPYAIRQRCVMRIDIHWTIVTNNRWEKREIWDGVR